MTSAGGIGAVLKRLPSDLRISLVQSGSFPPYRPSADLPLATLALAAGPAAIAVVMAGRTARREPRRSTSTAAS